MDADDDGDVADVGDVDDGDGVVVGAGVVFAGQFFMSFQTMQACRQSAESGQNRQTNGQPTQRPQLGRHASDWTKRQAARTTKTNRIFILNKGENWLELY